MLRHYFLTKYLRLTHPTEYVEGEPKGEEHNVHEEATASNKQKIKQPTLIEAVKMKNAYIANSSKKKTFLMHMTVEDFESYSVVDDLGFRCLLNGLDSWYEQPVR